MKKLLYILLFLQIISGVFIFFMLIGSDAFTAVLAEFICILQIALTLSVIRNTDETERLSEETFWLGTKLKELENIVNPYNSPESAVPAVYRGETACGTWECIKCGTVNKAGTDACQNCGAAYSAAINPTSNPYTKKKPRLSRFVK